MPKICYVHKNFADKTVAVINQANAIIAEYSRQGYELTLRQLYYQFVARDLIKNNQSEYSRLGGIINDARLAGLIDWDHITDRTRNVRSLSHWDSPSDIVAACARQYHRDLWKGQKHRVEVWIEKDALVGVIERVCNRLDVPYFSCRGYTSQSEMWEAAQRLARWRRKDFGGYHPVVLHLGDHDPSGIDMSRDIQDRLAMFMDGVAPTFRRLALNMNQVEQYNPPPNPAKNTDSRFDSYTAEHGDECWELDALEPSVIAGLVETNILEFRDQTQWGIQIAKQEREKKDLALVAGHWEEVIQHCDTMYQGGEEQDDDESDDDSDDDDQ